MIDEDIKKIVKELIDASNFWKNPILIQFDASPPIMTSTTKEDTMSILPIVTHSLEENGKEEETIFTLPPTLKTH